MTSKYFFVLLTLTILLSLPQSNARGGRGGGGRGGSRGSSSRGSSSRGSSSRGSSSSTNSQRGSSTIERKTSKNENTNYQPAAAPPPKAPEYNPPARVKPSAPQLDNPPPSAPRLPVQSVPNQAASNPNYGKPPPYPGGNAHPPSGNPPPYPGNAQPPQYPGGSQARPPPYPGTNQGGNVYGQPDAAGFRPNVLSPNAGGNTNLQQPGIRPYPQQPNVGNNPYPQQPGIRPYPQQPNVGNQPGMRPYPQQPNYGNQPGMPYRPYPQQPGMAYQAPSYSKYSGMPIGGSSYAKPYKKKGLLGHMFSKSPKTPKYGGYMGGTSNLYNTKYKKSHGLSRAMYPIIPLMALGYTAMLFRPRFHMPYMYGHHYGYHGQNYYSSHYYDWDNNEYRGRCVKPLLPRHSEMHCNRTHLGSKCVVNCKPGYHFPDNFTQKENECWQYAGVWRPMKNFPACEPDCEVECKNGGRCGLPNACVCDPVYRGDNCEYHVLNCDIRKLAGEKSRKISWTCQHRRNETTCSVRCRKPLASTDQNTDGAKELYCLPTGQWTQDELPKCDDDEVKTTEENKLSEPLVTAEPRAE